MLILHNLDQAVVTLIVEHYYQLKVRMMTIARMELSVIYISLLSLHIFHAILYFGWTAIFVVCGFTTTAFSRRMLSLNNSNARNVDLRIACIFNVSVFENKCRVCFNEFYYH